jgi:hypothetical protein
MGSRYFNQFMSSFHGQPVFIEGSFTIGSAGAVTANSFVGGGINASSTLVVQQKSTGTYQLTLADPYNRFLGASFTIFPAVSSTQYVDGSSSIIVGKSYQISASSALAFQSPGPYQANPTLGSTGTNWYTLGLPSNMTPYVGTPFVASSAASQLVGSSAAAVGTGWVQQITNSGIDHVEVLPDVNMQLSPSSTVTVDNGAGFSLQNNGAVLLIQTMKSSSGAPVLATNGTTIRYNLMVRNSSRAVYNESSSANPN